MEKEEPPNYPWDSQTIDYTLMEESEYFEGMICPACKNPTYKFRENSCCEHCGTLLLSLNPDRKY